LDAQKRAVRDFAAGGDWEVIGEFVEVESGKLDSRLQLQQAITRCDLTGATLIVAKLDRLSRNVAFLATLQESGTRFVAADMPEANELTIHIMAAVAQAERKAISTRTKEALAVARARGIQLGGSRGNADDLRRGPAISARVRIEQSRARARKVASHIKVLQEAGQTSLRQVAAALEAARITAPRGGRWSASQVARAIKLSND
jgi:DNA invertase Pin-like site-specific DNA recombinase